MLKVDKGNCDLPTPLRHRHLTATVANQNALLISLQPVCDQSHTAMPFTVRAGLTPPAGRLVHAKDGYFTRPDTNCSCQRTVCLFSISPSLENHNAKRKIHVPVGQWTLIIPICCRQCFSQNTQMVIHSESDHKTRCSETNKKLSSGL